MHKIMRSKLSFSGLLVGAFFLVSVLSSCLSQKQIAYFQAKNDTSMAIPYDTSFIATIHANDILNIFVTSINIEASKYFNFASVPEAVLSSSPGPNGYIVDAYGFVRLPLIGDVKVVGLTTRQANDTITRLMGKYLENPTVKLNIQNFKVTILGEVVHPGVYYNATEKMTITEALAVASDLPLYGRRDNIMVIREEKGKKMIGTIDLTSRTAFSSPYYYLHSNDIIYVEPMKLKKFGAEYAYKAFPILISAVTMTIVLIQFYRK